MSSRRWLVGWVRETWGVQGRSDPRRELFDVESVAGHPLSRGGVFDFPAAHREDAFPDAMFTDLFPSGRGRPSVPASMVATVLVLQALHGLLDREAAEAVTFNLRWKAACGIAVSAPAFPPTTLTYWRASGPLAAPDPGVRGRPGGRSGPGVLVGRNRRALDSTALDNAVATQDTVTQLVAAVRGSPTPSPASQGWSPLLRRAAITTTCIRASRRSPGMTTTREPLRLMAWSVTPLRCSPRSLPRRTPARSTWTGRR